MNELLQELQKSKIVKITGSYADGTYDENSDIDFKIKEDNPEWRFLGLKRNIEKIKEILDKYKIKVNSTMVGYWSTIGEKNEIEIELEFSDLFNHRKNRLKEVEIMGIKFKTY